jgi:hypothetical protein
MGRGRERQGEGVGFGGILPGCVHRVERGGEKRGKEGCKDKHR